MAKLVIYTALFGSYDDLIDPQEAYEECDFICFTDQKKITSQVWKIIHVDKGIQSASMANRMYKLLPHRFLSMYEESLYIDANIILKKNPYNLVKNYLKSEDFLMPKHSHRDCLYLEAKTCTALGKSQLLKTVKQIKRYKKEGFPKKFGLGENNVLLRKHNTSHIAKLMEFWYEELKNETQRDQLSLGYSLWKNNLKFNYIKENTRVLNEYFTYLPHKNRESFIESIKVFKSIKFRIRKILYYLCNKF